MRRLNCFMIGALVSAVFASGCVTQTKNARPPVPVEQIRFYERAPDNAQHLGFLAWQGIPEPNHPDPKAEDAAKSVLYRASKMGANGLVFVKGYREMAVIGGTRSLVYYFKAIYVPEE